jgi:DNA-binding XRE family transcriptional regulator
MPISATSDAAELAKMIGVSQAELLNILVARFGDHLISQINIETHHRANKIALRQWAKNNTNNPRRIIAYTVKAARYRSNLTQQQLADKLGWKAWVMADVELCRRVSKKKVRAIAATLNDPALNLLLIYYGWSDCTTVNSGQQSPSLLA